MTVFFISFVKFYRIAGPGLDDSVMIAAPAPVDQPHPKIRTSLEGKVEDNATAASFYGEPTVFQVLGVVAAMESARNIRDDAHVSVMEEGPAVVFAGQSEGNVVRLSHDARTGRKNEPCARL